MNKLKQLVQIAGLTNYEVGQKMKPEITTQGQRNYVNELHKGIRTLEVKEAFKLAKLLKCDIKELI